MARSWLAMERTCLSIAKLHLRWFCSCWWTMVYLTEDIERTCSTMILELAESTREITRTSTPWPLLTMLPLLLKLEMKILLKDRWMSSWRRKLPSMTCLQTSEDGNKTLRFRFRATKHWRPWLELVDLKTAQRKCLLSLLKESSIFEQLFFACRIILSI